MLTKPPCGKGPDACPRRYIACHASCEEYHEWMAIHEKEKAEIRHKKDAENEVSAFQAGLWKRRQGLADDRFWKERG